MIILRLTEAQAKICAQACEFFARIRMGQFQEIVWLCGKNHCAEDYDAAQRAWLDLRKQVYPDLDGPGHSYGVGHFPDADTAYDIHQVISRELGGKEPWSLNALPECYIKQNPKPLTYEELSRMVGEPVYVTVPGKPHRSKWCIVHSTMGGLCLARPDYALDLEAVKFGAVVVYRTKPEEVSEC